MYNSLIMQLILAGFLGWVVGAAVNYLSDVLPHKRRLVSPICVACGAGQQWGHYLIWPRRCSSCGTWRSFRVWIVEAVFIATSLWLWTSPPEDLGYWAGLTLLLYFGVVVVIDVEHRLILHPVSFAGAILCLGVGIWLHNLPQTLIGGLAGFGFMLLLYIFGNFFARWMARLRGAPIDEVALGFGDVNLAGVLGLLLGWPGIIGGLLLAILMGGVVSLIYIILMLIFRRYRAFAAIPYGPFLVAGAILLLYFREYLLAITALN